MNKKLIAVAIAGAFVAPAVAFAQNSTVSIYGTVNAEYGFVKGDGATATQKYNSADGFNSGASNIGFKGEEKLGGGMSAFFQCESDLAFLKGSAGLSAGSGSLCDRNSALGLKGGFGSFYVGTWDSPLKQAVGVSRMLGDTGWLGVTHLLLKDAAGKSFSDRNGNSINYDSPKMNGFQLNLQTSSNNADIKKTAAGLTGRSNSVNVLYSGGPLAAALGYTTKKDNVSAAAAQGGKDTAYSLGAVYTFGKAKVGITYVDMEVKSAAGVDTGRKSWNLAATYDLPGPHSVWAGYTNAGNTASTTATGAKEFQIGYKNTLSKRTFAAIGYGRVTNDTNGLASIAGAIAPTVGDKDSSVISMQLQHKF